MAKAGQEQGITVSFKGDAADFDKVVDKLNKEIKGLKKEVKLFNSELKFNPKSFSVLYVKIQNLTKQQEKAKEVLRQYKGYLDGLERRGLKGTDEWNATQEAIQKTNKEIRGITLQLDKAKQSMADLEKYATSGFADAVKKAGESLLAISEATEKISDASQRFLRETVNEAINFEDAFADVRKTLSVSGRTEEETEARYMAIANALRELSTTVPTTADELAKIAGLAGQMGVGEEYIVGFTKAMVDFGNATNITAEEAAEDIAQIYNVIGKGGNFNDLDELLSTIVELGNNSATTEKEIVEMFRNIASASSRVGMSESQMAALAATLSSLGLDKGGASAISNIMQQIDMAVDTNSKKLYEWARAAGLSTTKFKNAWNQDAAGALAGLLENLKQTVDAGGSLNKVFDDLGIKELRRVDTMGRLVNAQDVYAESLKMATEAYKDGNALSEEAAKRYETLRSKIQILKNKFDEFKRTIGDQLAPVFESIVGFAGRMLDIINALPGGVNMLITVLTTLMAVLSPLLGITGKYLVNLVGTEGKLGGLISKFTGFKGVLTGVLGAFILLYTQNEDFRNAVNKMALEIWGVLKPALESIWGIFKKVWEILGFVIEKMMELWSLFMDTTAGQVFMGILEGIVEAIKVVIQIIGGLIKVVQNLFDWFGRVLGLEDKVANNMPSMDYISNGGAFQSGGFMMSGGMTVNNSFVINGTEQLSNTRLIEVADIITDRVNENLGRMV